MARGVTLDVATGQRLGRFRLPLRTDAQLLTPSSFAGW